MAEFSDFLPYFTKYSTLHMLHLKFNSGGDSNLCSTADVHIHVVVLHVAAFHQYLQPYRTHSESYSW